MIKLNGRWTVSQESEAGFFIMAKEIKDAMPNGGGQSEEKRTRKSPVPANYDRIMEGALRLPLKERVDIKNALAASIEKELVDLEEKLKQSRTLANGVI